MFKFVMVFLASILTQVSFADASKSGAWKIVENKNVCMVTDMHFSRPQIPVSREGKTYYGCCENCKATIQKDATARMATDPLTKNPVDKAKAIIAANGSGEVLYFENEANFAKYLKQAESSQK